MKKGLMFLLTAELFLNSCYMQRPISKPIEKEFLTDKVTFTETKKNYVIKVKDAYGSSITYVDEGKDLSLDYFVLDAEGKLFLYAKDEQGTRFVEDEQVRFITYFNEVNPALLEQKLEEKSKK